MHCHVHCSSNHLGRRKSISMQVNGAAAALMRALPLLARSTSSVVNKSAFLRASRFLCSAQPEALTEASTYPQNHLDHPDIELHDTQPPLSRTYSVKLKKRPDDQSLVIPEVFGSVHSTESFSTVDGPGIRYLVFMQGCAMRCLFCSNPDTWSMQGGTKTSSKELAQQIFKVKNYLKSGGVTTSGGEAMLQPEFLAALFQEVHHMGLNTTIDTTGQGTKLKHWDVVLPHTDLVLWCIKHIDPRKYEALTGMKQKGALRFAEELAVRDIPFYLRYVYIPGYTDDPKDINNLIKYVKQQPTFQGIELLPYHVLGRNKWEVLNIPYPLEGVRTPDKDSVHRVIKTFNDAGVPVICAE